MPATRAANLTFKQLDALYWTVQLKGFQAAADRLYTSQSAISKRIKDLERLFDTRIFERSGHSVRLTEPGKELFSLAEHLLTERDHLLQAFADHTPQPRRFRLGCTESIAMTWLPDLLVALGRAFPQLTIEPEVDIAVRVVQQLAAGEIDLAIVPEMVVDASQSRTRLGVMQYAWVCRPGLIAQGPPITLQQLARHTLLMQRYEQSPSVRTCIRWLRSCDVTLGKIIHCTNLHGLIGMTRVGLGVGYLPVACVQTQLKSGELMLAPVAQTPPAAALALAHAACGSGDLIRAVAAVIQTCCPLPQD